jgi:hypothetical protein
MSIRKRSKSLPIEQEFLGMRIQKLVQIRPAMQIIERQYSKNFCFSELEKLFKSYRDLIASSGYPGSFFRQVLRYNFPDKLSPMSYDECQFTMELLREENERQFVIRSYYYLNLLFTICYGKEFLKYNSILDILNENKLAVLVDGYDNIMIKVSDVYTFYNYDPYLPSRYYIEQTYIDDINIVDNVGIAINYDRIIHPIDMDNTDIYSIVTFVYLRVLGSGRFPLLGHNDEDGDILYLKIILSYDNRSNTIKATVNLEWG